MPWHDRHAQRVIEAMREQFMSRRIIETGSAEGNGLIMYSPLIFRVSGCESDHKLAFRSQLRSARLGNATVECQSSPEFIVDQGKSPGWNRIYVLDAHTPGSWPILDELKAIAANKEPCCLVIHDFKVEGQDLGYICYDGQALDLPLVEKDLLAVNPDFCLYTNTLASCDIWTRAELKAHLGDKYDKYFDQSMDYVWSSPVKTYRGILYATPEPLADEMGLRRIR